MKKKIMKAVWRYIIMVFYVFLAVFIDSGMVLFNHFTLRLIIPLLLVTSYVYVVKCIGYHYNKRVITFTLRRV